MDSQLPLPLKSGIYVQMPAKNLSSLWQVDKMSNRKHATIFWTLYFGIESLLKSFKRQ